VGAIEANGWDCTAGQMPYRCVFGAYRGVTDHSICVSTAAVQYAGGSLDAGRISAPSIDLMGSIENLNSDQARDLASALLEAAAEIDGWAGR
jgi:hypothetical protein